MKTLENIVYNSAFGFRGEGDLFLPDAPDNAPAALLIHGGGWNTMDRNSIFGVARFLVERGYGVFNINYRLLKDAPWPACGDDCLKASDFIIEAKHPAMRILNREKLLVVGASAGGHLALMTGLRLPPEKAKAVVAISPVADLAADYEYCPSRYTLFCGKSSVDEKMLKAASPVNFITSDSPPVLCLHSINDKVVESSQSTKFEKIGKEKGATVEAHFFESSESDHGIWADKAPQHRLLPELEERIEKFLRAFC